MHGEVYVIRTQLGQQWRNQDSDDQEPFKSLGHRGGSVKCPTLAQVMILWFMGLSCTSGSVLTAQSLKPVADSGSPCLSKK